MSESFKAYPEYRDSGIPWIGKLPCHWVISRVKNCFTYAKEMNREGNQVQVLSLTLRGVVDNNPDAPEGLVPKDYGTYQWFRKGNLVFKLIDLENFKTSRVGLVHRDGIMSPAYVRLMPNEAESARFFYHQFYDLYQRAVFNQLGAGVRSTLGPSDLLNLPVFIPRPDEQAAIVKYLDHAERRIRKYIAAKRRLIALLTEQKQAVIHRAVTRGLDPAAPLRPSGIPWLGDIPAHWELTRVKDEFHCLNTKRVPLSSTERGAMTRREYDYYGASGVIDKVEDYIFDDELLLIAEDGANLVLRNLPLAIIARGKFWVNNHAHILKPKCGNLDYLAAVLETINYRPWITGAAQPKLTQDRLLSITLGVAPRSEQDAIMAYVDQATAPLRTTIATARREIDLLREYRTRLIADVVTGKLDVREAAAALPELPADLVADTPDTDAEDNSADPDSENAEAEMAVE